MERKICLDIFCKKLKTNSYILFFIIMKKNNLPLTASVLTQNVNRFKESTIMKFKSSMFLFLAVMVLSFAMGLTACSEDTNKDTTQTPTITEVSPTSVKVGKQILITGTNFSTTVSDNKVTINDIECKVTFATTYQLIITVPTMESGTYPVVITVNDVTVMGPDVEIIKPAEVVVKNEVITVTKDVIKVSDVSGDVGIHAIENIGNGHLLLASSDDNKPNVIYDYNYATKSIEEIYQANKTWYWTMTCTGNNVLLASKANGRVDLLNLNTKSVTELVTSLPQLLRACTDAEGNLYVLLRDEAKVYKYNGISGDGQQMVLNAKDTDGLLRDMCFDNDGNLLVLGNSVIYCIAPGSNEAEIIAGYPKQEATNDDLHDYIGNPEECRFVKGRTIFCDSKGYVWFCDEWNITRVFTKGTTGYRDGSIKIITCAETSNGKLGEVGQFCESPSDAEHEVWAVSWNDKTVYSIKVEYE